MNKEDLTIIESSAVEENREGLEIIEEDAFENQLSEEELLKFYEENQDAIDLIGGLEMFESLMGLEDEQFEQLKPNILAVFSDVLLDKATEKELRLFLLEKDYDEESLKEDFDTAATAIDEIDFLSKIKKDFLKEIYMMAANKLQELLEAPVYAHKTDAGLDIYAREEITIAPGETKIIGTGIKVAIPEGYAILIQPRSGQSVKTKLRIANTPGLIDSGYRDEIGVIIENIEPPFKDIDYEFDNNGEIRIKSIEHGQSYTIVEGQRFAQMRLVQVPKAEFVEVESVGEIGEDRGGGFGSTGIG